MKLIEPIVISDMYSIHQDSSQTSQNLIINLHQHKKKSCHVGSCKDSSQYVNYIYQLSVVLIHTVHYQRYKWLTGA